MFCIYSVTEKDYRKVGRKLVFKASCFFCTSVKTRLEGVFKAQRTIFTQRSVPLQLHIWLCSRLQVVYIRI